MVVANEREQRMNRAYQNEDIAASHPEIVEWMSAHYEAWWKEVEVELTARWGDAHGRTRQSSQFKVGETYRLDGQLHMRSASTAKLEDTANPFS